MAFWSSRTVAKQALSPRGGFMCAQRWDKTFLLQSSTNLPASNVQVECLRYGIVRQSAYLVVMRKPTQRIASAILGRRPAPFCGAVWLVHDVWICRAVPACNPLLAGMSSQGQDEFGPQLGSSLVKSLRLMGVVSRCISAIAGMIFVNKKGSY